MGSVVLINPIPYSRSRRWRTICSCPAPQHSLCRTHLCLSVALTHPHLSHTSPLPHSLSRTDTSHTPLFHSRTHTSLTHLSFALSFSLAHISRTRLAFTLTHLSFTHTHTYTLTHLTHTCLSLSHTPLCHSHAHSRPLSGRADGERAALHVNVHGQHIHI